MAGQPTKYQPKFVKMLIDFFDVKPTKKKRYTETATDFPTLAAFAIKIGVHRDTLNEWARIHEDFRDACKRAKDVQENWLLQNGLHGRIDKSMAIFTLKNVCNYRDQRGLELTGKDGGAIVYQNMDDKTLDKKIDNLIDILKGGKSGK